MKIIMTGSERAHCLATLIPSESWQKGCVSMSQGPLKGGLETFVFEMPGLDQREAVELVRQVLSSHPATPLNTWYPRAVPIEGKKRKAKRKERAEVTVRSRPFDWAAVDRDHNTVAHPETLAQG